MPDRTNKEIIRKPVNPNPTGDDSQLHSRYTALQQQVIDLKDRLDLEFARFGRMNSFHTKVLQLNEISEVPPIVTEAIVDIFEMEFGAMFLLDEIGRIKSNVEVFGIDIDQQLLQQIAYTLLEQQPEVIPFQAQQIDKKALHKISPQANLGHLAYSFIQASDLRLQALIFSGNSVPGMDFYEMPSAEILEIFSVFSRQVGSLMDSLKSRHELLAKDRMIVESETLRRTAAVKQRQAEILARAAVNPAVVEGDAHGLAFQITETVAKEFGIGRVGVWLFEEDGSRLVNIDNYIKAAEIHTSGAVLLAEEYKEEFYWLRHSKYVDGNDPLTDTRLKGYLKNYVIPHRITAMLDAAIRVGDRTLGAVCLEHVAKPHIWTDDEIVFACQLADQVALTIANGWRRRAESEAQAARAQAEMANRAKSEFLANMSHELRTPLNAILGLTEGLLEQNRGPLNERQQNSLNTVQASGRHLLELINEVLDLARIEAGRLEIIREWTAAREICEAGIAMVREQASAKGVKVGMQLSDTELKLMADPRRLKQILVNLLSNAVKFTDEGGQVSLTVAPTPDNEALQFIVKDTGIGIAKADQEQLFRPFVQLDAGLSRRHEGTGLGLSLVQRLVDLHGGSVTVESETGKGSNFTVTLPVGHKPKPVRSIKAEEKIQPLQPTVLVVEDSPEAYTQLAGYLGELGYSVSMHTHGAGAFEAVRDRQPGLVVLDILLPDLSGWEILAQLKTEPETRDIPVLIISVVDEPGRAITAGAAGHLLKPVSRAALAKILGAKENKAVSGKRRRVLLAEDNEWNIQTVAGYLEDHGFDVSVARDGLDALEQIESLLPDIVLMDIQMPRLDGLEATRRLRSNPRFALTPVLALTALVMPGDAERCLSAGASAYLSKPVSMSELVTTINALLIPETRELNEDLK
jgi:signal transduction histidine kinase/CheY-like chemotaxis protein